MKNMVGLVMLLVTQVAFGARPPRDLELNSECKEFIESIDSRYNYDWIKTAEVPGGRDEIYMFYYYKKTSNLANPVIFFNGGPGYSSHGAQLTLEIGRVKAGASNIDFIYIDQRGTGCSSPFPKGTDSKTISKLQWYGSAGIVMDAEELRKKIIGDKKWKIFGQSFGGYVVHRYIKMFPASIKKAYSHGFPVGPSDFDFSFSRVASQALVLQEYLKMYPHDRARLKVINEFLSDRSRCYQGPADEYCGYEIITDLTYKLGFRDQWAGLHGWIVSMAPAYVVVNQGVQDYVEKAARGEFFYHNISPQTEASLQHQNIALNFLGVKDTNNSPMDEEKCLAIYKKIETVHKIKSNDILLDECKAPVQFRYNDYIYEILRAKIRETDMDFVRLDEIKKSLNQYKIPFYLYSGSLDSFIPKDLFREEVKVLGKLVQYTNFSTSGHEGFHTEKQIFLDLTK